MVFSSPLFISVFFPVLLIVYFSSQKRFRNTVLLGSSLFFYTWGDPRALPLLLFVIIFNYLAARLIHKSARRKLWLALAVIVNLLLLAIFKYLDFLVTNLDHLLHAICDFQITPPNLLLPIGISFYIFQSLSYIVDVYRRHVPPQKDPFAFALYISLFPQLIAGPIVRYISIENDLFKRQLIRANVQSGLARFCVGLAKKVFIADNMGFIADCIFNTPTEQIPCLWAWAGAIVFSLQIYYDFSAYSDMAIGIGKMFNFNFPENFNYPYCARTLQDFWRRWHMSLTTWLKDYLYIPLGGSKGTVAKTRRNILIVLVCCGIWHGAAWNFLLWGFYNGVGLIGERILFRKKTADNPYAPGTICHSLLTLLFILIGWVIFRCDSLMQSVVYLRIMFLGNGGYSIYSLEIAWNECLTFSNIIFFLIAIVCCKPIPGFNFGVLERSAIMEVAALILFFITYSFVLTSSYSPFLYFRF